MPFCRVCQLQARGTIYETNLHANLYTLQNIRTLQKSQEGKEALQNKLAFLYKQPKFDGKTASECCNIILKKTGSFKADYLNYASIDLRGCSCLLGVIVNAILDEVPHKYDIDNINENR